MVHSNSSAFWKECYYKAIVVDEVREEANTRAKINFLTFNAGEDMDDMTVYLLNDQAIYAITVIVCKPIPIHWGLKVLNSSSGLHKASRLHLLCEPKPTAPGLRFRRFPCRTLYTGGFFTAVPRLCTLFSPLHGLFDDAAGFTSCCGLDCCSPCLWQVLLSMRFYTQISPFASILSTKAAWPLL